MVVIQLLKKGDKRNSSGGGGGRGVQKSLLGRSGDTPVPTAMKMERIQGTFFETAWGISLFVGGRE